MDVEAIKQRQAETWGLGDYEPLARQLAPAAAALCDACAVSAGQEVLDVAAGNGNFALACAREGAGVVASDLSPGMVERGRRRAAEEGFEIEWVEADAEALPFEDGRFDCAGSVFGAMIAPRPEVAAAELFRVVRPGGTVGLTAWTPESVATQLFDIGRRYVPPPQEMPRADEWGTEEIVRSRLQGLAAHVELERRTLTWSAPSLDEFARVMFEAAPPQVAARRQLSPEQFDAMRNDMLEFVRGRNRADDESLAIDAEYLVTVARRRG